MRNLSGFVAYPASPTELGQLVKACQRELHDSHRVSSLRLWQENDIVGRFISTTILEGISDADYLVADVMSWFSGNWTVGVSRLALCSAVWA